MKIKSKRQSMILATVLALLLLAVPVVLALDFNDVPPGHWAYAAIDRISNLHITVGCGGGNYCPDSNVTRAQMAGFINNLTNAYTAEDEPYIMRLDHQRTSGNYPALITMSFQGDGVQGFSYGAFNQADNGVYGETNSGDDSEAGVKGVSTNNAAGGYFRGSGELTPDIILGGASDSNDNGNIWSDPNYAGSDIVMRSNDEFHIYLDNDDSEGASFAVYNGIDLEAMRVDESGMLYLGTTNGIIYAGSNTATDLYLEATDDIYAELDQDNNNAAGCFYIRDGANNQIASWCEAKSTATGVQVQAVNTSAGAREMYVPAATEVWFEDVGSASLVDGQAQVAFDPVFAEAANLSAEYQVFLTPVGDQPVLLYVKAKTPTGFEVGGVSLDGQPAAAGFDYRIVARRAGYEDWRLQVSEPTDAGDPAADTPPEVYDVGEDAPVPGQPVIESVTEEGE